MYQFVKRCIVYNYSSVHSYVWWCDLDPIRKTEMDARDLAAHPGVMV